MISRRQLAGERAWTGERGGCGRQGRRVVVAPTTTLSTSFRRTDSLGTTGEGKAERSQRSSARTSGARSGNQSHSCSSDRSGFVSPSA